MAKKRQVLAVCLLVATTLIGTYFVLLRTSQFSRQGHASLSFELQNQTNKSLNVSFYLYVGYMNFNDTNTTIVHGNFTALTISDGSGIHVEGNALAPFEYLSLKIHRLESIPSMLSVSSARLSVSFQLANESDFDYIALISFLNDQGMSVASLYYSKVDIYVQVQERTTSLYLDMLIVALSAFFIGAVAMTVGHWVKWFPLITASILSLTLSLYIFVGSAYEIGMRNMVRLLAPLSVFIHGSDWHIFGNLSYFLVLSVLFEYFLNMRNQWMKRDMLLWYFVPLLVPTALVVTPWGGFGLSLSVEIMTWTLWAYIIRNYEELITSKIHTLLVVLAGIPSYLFIGWIVSYSFGFDVTPFDSSEALLHIVFGILSGVGILFIVFWHDIMQRLKARKKNDGAEVRSTEVLL